MVLNMTPFPELDIISLIKSMDSGTLTLLGAACGVMLSMHFTMQLISQHLFYWKKPKEQKDIIFIVLMAPFYAFVSFFGLLDVEGGQLLFTFLVFAKDCYEALVIAKFLSLMYSYVNISISTNVVPGEIRGREIRHSFPLSLFLPYRIRVENHTLKLLKFWVWQFVVVRAGFSFLELSLRLLGMFPSWISWTIILTINLSVSMALYALVIFYHVFAKELTPHKPLSKFFCVVGIVFFTFWQGAAFELLAAAGFVQSHHFWLKVEHPQKAIMSALVILQMAFFSVVQQYAYHFAPYSGLDNAKNEKHSNKNE